METIEELINKTRRLATEGDIEEAEKCLLGALHIDQWNPEVRDLQQALNRIKNGYVCKNPRDLKNEREVVSTPTIAERKPVENNEDLKKNTIDRVIKSSTPHEILQVKQNASKEEVNRSYKELVKLVHPDRNKGHPEANNAIMALRKARETMLKSSGTPT